MANNNPKRAKKVETLTHDQASRTNIPTIEYQPVVEDQEQQPVEVRYPRNVDLDPQLFWRGKDEQNWSDLVTQAPPLFIQEKVHPKVLIDDLLRGGGADQKNRAPCLTISMGYSVGLHKLNFISMLPTGLTE